MIQKKDFNSSWRWMPQIFNTGRRLAVYKSNLTEYPVFGMQLVVWI
jgi:hypothetical protein